MSRFSSFSSVLLLILLGMSFLMTFADAIYIGKEECPRECDRRCSATSHKKPCLFFCNMCCQKCLCVPSGTYGHKEECPCYNDWKTKEGKPKCP